MPPSSDQASNAPEWLLVVDDDEPIRTMVAESLAPLGLKVVGAASGDEAFAVLAARADEPLLVLIDVLMPGVDGLTLARRLQARLKRSSLVIMSGHMSNLSWWPTDLREVPFLAKPFRMAELIDLIADARGDSRPQN